MAVDGDRFRSIMGAFPTGVAIVTTLEHDGTPRGLTTNAFCSVSAEPPLLLVCVDRDSRTLRALRLARRFVVNFVAAERAGLCAVFATKSADKFAGVDWRPGDGGLPVLAEDAFAWAECTIERELELGDHVVVVGLVTGGQPPDAEQAPLLYFQRSYWAWAAVAAPASR